MSLEPEDRELAVYLLANGARLEELGLVGRGELDRLREALGAEPGYPKDAAPPGGGASERPRALDLAATVRRSAPPTTSEKRGDRTLAEDPSLDRDREPGVEVSISSPGKEKAARYAILKEIARGGMGRILRARDTEIGREVAVKALLRGTQAEDTEVRRFWMEVQATGQLEHPSIIPIHDVGRLPSGELFYVMKLLSGRTLAEILFALGQGDPATRSEFSRARLLTAFQQIAYAVAFAHARGVLHRDIKPANIMIGRYGEAMLLDWGLAKLLRRADASLDRPSAEPQVGLHGWLSAAETAAGMITGTPQYMAPEATEGRAEALTEKSDVYGLGATLYEILTLEPAYPDVGFVETILRVREGRFTPPRARAPERKIPIELEELCLQAMGMDPALRPTAKQLADDVGRILEGTREHERRQREAKLRVIEGKSAVERWKQLRSSLKAIDGEAKRLAQDIPAWASVERKRDLWTLQDRAAALEIEAISAFEEAETAFQRALGELSDHAEARSAMASLYFQRFTQAERSHDEAEQRYFKNLVARYDDGAWSRILAGDGTLAVTASEPDVDVRLHRFVLRDRALSPSFERDLGEAPIEPLDIPMGSYLLTLTGAGGLEVRRPVSIGRTESVHVYVKVRSAAEVGAEFVLIPAGECVLGGDSLAYGAPREQRVVNVREVAIARFPVTVEEYLAFLNALAKDDLDLARRHVPRVRMHEGHYWPWSEERRCFELPPPEQGKWALRHPVSGVSYEDALAYIEWRKSITGERLRLPHEDEWEKAARGADARAFPWGNHFDPTFCKMKDSRNLPHPEPEPVGTFETDESPYGVRDMAGGVREICVTYKEGGIVPVMRGGCWHDTELFCRVAFRHVTKADFVNTGLGFRLAKDLD